MRLWAFNFLVRKGYRADSATQGVAEECSSEAAIQLLNAHFPFDTNFYAWAHVIVLNTCRKYFRSQQKKSLVPDNQLIALESVQNYLEASSHTDREYLTYLRDTLIDALSKLPNARREVIALTYLEELTPKEIAAKMGKSLGAVYSLRFYALQDLRKILGKNRNNLYE